MATYFENGEKKAQISKTEFGFDVYTGVRGESDRPSDMQVFRRKSYSTIKGAEKAAMAWVAA